MTDSPTDLYILEQAKGKYKECSFCHIRPAEDHQQGHTWDSSESDQIAPAVVLEAAKRVFGEHDPSCLEKAKAQAASYAKQKVEGEIAEQARRKVRDEVFYEFQKFAEKMGWELTKKSYPAIPYGR